MVMIANVAVKYIENNKNTFLEKYYKSHKEGAVILFFNKDSSLHSEKFMTKLEIKNSSVLPNNAYYEAAEYWNKYPNQLVFLSWFYPIIYNTPFHIYSLGTVRLEWQVNLMEETQKEYLLEKINQVKNQSSNNSDNWKNYIVGIATCSFILGILAIASYVYNDPYRILENYLQSQDWEKADLQTKNILLKLANAKGFLDKDDIEKFNCSDIKKIDDLWINNTKKQFGFSVQVKILDEIITNLNFDQQTPYTSLSIYTDKPKVMGMFGNRVGWLIKSESEPMMYSNIQYNLDASPKYLNRIWRPSLVPYYNSNSNYIYNLDAPIGHLPSWYFLKKCIAPEYFCENEDVNRDVIFRAYLLSMLQKVKQCNL